MARAEGDFMRNPGSKWHGDNLTRAERRKLRREARQAKAERAQVNAILRNRERAHLIEQQAREARAEERRLG